MDTNYSHKFGGEGVGKQVHGVNKTLSWKDPETNMFQNYQDLLRGKKYENVEPKTSNPFCHGKSGAKCVDLIFKEFTLEQFI